MYFSYLQVVLADKFSQVANCSLAVSPYFASIAARVVVLIFVWSAIALAFGYDHVQGFGEWLDSENVYVRDSSGGPERNSSFCPESVKLQPVGYERFESHGFTHGMLL
jgi:hypothetical protein